MPTPLLFAILLASSILILAFTVNWFLRRRHPDNPTFKKVQIIVRSWFWILAPFLFSLWVGPIGVAVLFYILTLIGVYEYLNVSSLAPKKWVLFPLINVGITIQYLFLLTENREMFFATIPLLILTLVPLMVLVIGQVEDIPKIFASLTGCLLLSYYLSCIPALLILDPHMWSNNDQALWAVICLVLLTEINDVFQFLSGKLFGRRKVVPTISPNKTEAGFIGGVILTSLLSSVLLSSLLGITPLMSFLMGTLISLCGMLGDLFFSAVKRNFGTKDFSEAIPGHGGLLDRLDSLVVTAPLFFHSIRFLLER